MVGEDLRFLLMVAVAWFTTFSLILYIPALVYRFQDYHVGTGLATGWLVTSISGVRSPGGARTETPTRPTGGSS